MQLLTDSKLKEVYKRINSNPIDIDFFRHQLTRGRLSGYIFHRLPLIYEQVEAVYPGMWEMQAWVEWLNDDPGTCKFTINPFIVIKFSKFDITNSKNMSRTIQDLYVGILIKTRSDEDGNIKVVVDTIRGTRGKLDYNEYSSGYLHSHLTPFNSRRFQRRRRNDTEPQFFKSFCQGTEGMNEAEVMLNTNFDANTFRLYLYQIDNYVRWESLEGGPHKRMESIKDDRKAVTIATSMEEVNDILSMLDEVLHIDDFDIIFTDGRFKILPNYQLHETLIGIIPEKFHVRRDEKGYEYSITSEDIEFENVELVESDVMWNQKCIGFIAVTPPVSEETFDVYIYKPLLDLILEYLEAKLAKNILQKTNLLHEQQ